jgi:uncharacterized protein YbaR (Trm112 family)
MSTKSACSACLMVNYDMMACPNCKLTHYCDKSCQTKDWKAHKLSCEHIKRQYDLESSLLDDSCNSVKSQPSGSYYKVRTCICCGKSGKIPKKCAACNMAHYCSVECQKSDWSTHKDTCSDMKRQYEQICSIGDLIYTLSFRSLVNFAFVDIRYFGSYIDVLDTNRFLEECKNNPNDMYFFSNMENKNVIKIRIPKKNSMDIHHLNKEKLGYDIIVNRQDGLLLNVRFLGLRAYLITL